MPERDPRELRLNLLSYTLSLLFLGIAIAFNLYYEDAIDLPLQTVAALSTALMAVSLLVLTLFSRRRIWYAPTSFAFIFCIFHFGLIICQAFDLHLSKEFHDYIKDWWFKVNTKYAITLVCIGLAAFVAGTAAATTLNRAEPQRSPQDLQDRQAVCKLGFCILLASVGLWFIKVMQAGGLGLLLQSYADFRSSTYEVFSAGYNYYFIGLGLILLAVSSPCRLRRAGLALFVLFAVVALPLGLRSQVLFPSFAALTAVGLRHPPITTRKMLVVGLCLLTLISVVRQVREVGLADLRVEQLSLVPWEGMAEMGSSLRPVAEVVGWSRKGVDYIFGASYWAPFSRALVYVVPGMERPPINEDERLLGEVIGRRVGSIGFSIIAEAYTNFGRGGVLVIMFLLGGALARIGELPVTVGNQVRVGVIVLPLMMHIRNSFVLVPVSIVLGLTMAFVLERLPGLFASRREKHFGMVER